MFEALIQKEAKLAVVGLGYVGLPLAMEFAKRFSVIGYDINEERLARMRRGEDPCGELPSEAFIGRDILFTADQTQLAEARFFVIAVPTPIDSHNEPDLSPLLGSRPSTVCGKEKRKKSSSFK